MGKYNRPTIKAKKAVATPRGVVAKENIKKGDMVVVEPKKVETPAPRKIAETTENYEKMNIYKKIQRIRKKLVDIGVTKSGINEDKDFQYFQLGDYLPQINKLGDEMGLMTKFDMTKDRGVLKIINIDNSEEVLEWELPTADLQMQDDDGNQAEGIQIMKGKSTYMRRALFENAYEISVKDTVDNRGKKEEQKLDPRDTQALQEATDIEQLNTIANSIRTRKGFENNYALLKEYAECKKNMEVKNENS